MSATFVFLAFYFTSATGTGGPGGVWAEGWGCVGGGGGAMGLQIFKLLLLLLLLLF